ncbi:uncharacterized protein LOC106706594 [Latimeria chalumnae]|uniref:uncharacterized protein LOC106706594 n=1 Tax=Latimeria chalumnae TaxID=7897 RepID=UPI0006D8E79E|nr:PREDICTED: uncharacterized protein LOC106706594 [Latimeria chalumnae]|eukprot:XP_014353248.1 PREDICTED: uncharacterized protein LOC106706594 [Latimeria chalumnae]
MPVVRLTIHGYNNSDAGNMKGTYWMTVKTAENKFTTTLKSSREKGERTFYVPVNKEKQKHDRIRISGYRNKLFTKDSWSLSIPVLEFIEQTRTGQTVVRKLFPIEGRSASLEVSLEMVDFWNIRKQEMQAQKKGVADLKGSQAEPSPVASVTPEAAGLSPTNPSATASPRLSTLLLDKSSMKALSEMHASSERKETSKTDSNVPEASNRLPSLVTQKTMSDTVVNDFMAGYEMAESDIPKLIPIFSPRKGLKRSARQTSSFSISLPHISTSVYSPSPTDAKFASPGAPFSVRSNTPVPTFLTGVAPAMKIHPHHSEGFSCADQNTPQVKLSGSTELQRAKPAPAKAMRTPQGSSNAQWGPTAKMQSRLNLHTPH